MSSYLIKHSAVGSLIRYATQGNLHFSRSQAKNISPASSSPISSSPGSVADDVSDQEKNESAIAATNIVDWSGPDDPSNPQNWPTYQKVIITVVLWYV